MTVPVWREHAACQGLELSIFFPADDAEAVPAKLVCERCLVRVACLDDALDRREREGVWGGYTEKERLRIQRRRRRAS